MNSALYVGSVTHRRHAPVSHGFRHHLFMLYLDLAELDSVFRGRWLWSVERPNLASFRRADHLGPCDVPLDAAVRDLVNKEIDRRPEGPIRLLTHPRYFGYVMNPVSFYYCFDEAETRVEAIVAEITNTPWHERHCYVLDALSERNINGKHHYRLKKDFHVSPFMAMDYRYDWRFTEPGKRLSIVMRNERDGRSDFEAAMVLERHALDGANLARALLRQPFMTERVTTAIYWQAFRLWRKGARFYPHPKHTASNEE
ncbi:MAG: DUF1365 domain-containing protein [Gammaproteobacteria bacterium]